MRNTRKIAAVLSMAMAISAVTGVNAFAADKAFELDVANWTDQDWNSIAMTNDDTVSSGAVIRSEASADSEAVGYLYRGAAVEILSKDDKWTQIESGSVTGYVMNDYLVSGDAARGLAEYYGKEGVVAKWDDVNVFAARDAGSVTRTVKDGTAFPLVADEGHWLLVQQGADSAGYVSEDDASRMLLVDTAVPVSGDDEISSYEENLGGTVAAGASADSGEDTSADYSEAAFADYGEEASADYSAEASADYSEAASADYSGEASADYSEEASADYSEEAAADYSGEASADYSGDTSSAAQTDASQAYQTQTVSSDPNVQALYDAYIAAQNAAMNCTSAEDAEAKAQAAKDAYSAYLAAAGGTSAASSVTADQVSSDTASQTVSQDASQTQTPQTEAAPAETQETAAPVETPQTEAPAQTGAPVQTEAPQTEAAKSSSTGSYADYSDLDLLAAIIWCEAGNQPYDGMVAVGEVVMNRVASPSFPNTIAEVLEQPGQFTPYASGTLQSALASGVNSTCYQAAQDALNGAQPVPGALYFNTHSGTTKIGAHYFS